MERMQTHEQPPEKPAPSREERFVTGVLKLCGDDKGVAARLRRADNPATEYQSWELLANYGINLEKEFERLPFVSVAAAIAKAKVERNGNLGLGRAIAASYEKGNNSDQAKTRLRRLLACDDLVELCRILRPLFSLIDSKAEAGLDYVRLLKQLRRFAFSPDPIKAQWAQDFYGQPAAVEEESQ